MKSATIYWILGLLAAVGVGYVLYRKQSKETSVKTPADAAGTIPTVSDKRKAPVTVYDAVSAIYANDFTQSPTTPLTGPATAGAALPVMDVQFAQIIDAASNEITTGGVLTGVQPSQSVAQIAPSPADTIMPL